MAERCCPQAGRAECEICIDLTWEEITEPLDYEVFRYECGCDK